MLRTLANAVARIARQRLTEWRLRRRGVVFRESDRERACAAYGSMSADEFARINAPQDLLNEALLPQLVRQCPADAPLLAVDLGCGDGSSTGLLARLLPAGSRLIGYELCSAFVARARRRPELPSCEQDFVQQSIDEPLRDVDGRPLPDNSVDLVHAAGVVGHHLTNSAARELAAEVARVLKPGGRAILDPGPNLPRKQLVALMARSGLRPQFCRRVLPWGARTPIVFARGDGSGADRRSHAT